MTHDPLCYRSHDQPLGRDPFCQCDMIVKARALGRNDLMQEQDENENTYPHGYQAGHAIGTEEALARIDIWINLNFANHKPEWLSGLRRAVIGGYVEKTYD